MMRSPVLFVLAAALSAGDIGPARSQPAPRFDLPVRCTPGDDCFVQNHVDHDPGAGWRDFSCGHLSYDGHHGTDFRVRSLADMERGMEVLAAAAGVVRGTRDGEPDVSVRERGAESLGGRHAGNGVLLDHGQGWETQYSHLKRGTVRVRPGQRVERGQVLGLVGLSGNTEFPHVDFVIRREGRPIDPFAPDRVVPARGGQVEAGSREAGQAGPAEADQTASDSAQADVPECEAAAGNTLWTPDAEAKLAYHATGVLIAGFAPEPAERVRAQRGDYDGEIDSAAESLVFFIELFGVQRGDRERIELRDPRGRSLIVRQRVIEGNHAARFGYVGRRRNGERWSPGEYEARYRLERDGRPVVSLTRSVTLR